MATTRRRRVVIFPGYHGFGPQTGRTNGIGDRHERFLASQAARAPGLRFASATGLLLQSPLQSLLREQELCLVALRGRVSETPGVRKVSSSDETGRGLGDAQPPPHSSPSCSVIGPVSVLLRIRSGSRGRRPLPAVVGVAKRI